MSNFFRDILIWIIQLEAKLVLRKYKPRIVAVTGTVGKTATKDAIYEVLRKNFSVRKSQKSFNSEVGVPLTIIYCPTGWRNASIWIKNVWKGLWLLLWRHNYPEWLVLEAGVGKTGDMDVLTRWIHADVVVFTRFSETPVHMEFFPSAEAVIEEKLKLLAGAKDDAIVVYNADDKKMSTIETRQHSVYTFGKNDKATVQIKQSSISYENSKPNGLTVTIGHGEETHDIFLPTIIGTHYGYTFAAAIAVGVGLGISLGDSVQALENLSLPPGRMNVVEGEKETIIIDDSYNSSPVATEGALETLEQIESPGRKIVALGDMTELGDNSEEAHRNIGAQVAKICDIVVTVGTQGRFLADAAREGGLDAKNVFEFNTAHEAGEFLQQTIQSGDVILIKCSQAMRMERAVVKIMKHPEDREKLLVRQEPVWQEKK